MIIDLLHLVEKKTRRQIAPRFSLTIIFYIKSVIYLPCTYTHNHSDNDSGRRIPTRAFRLYRCDPAVRNARVLYLLARIRVWENRLLPLPI